MKTTPLILLTGCLFYSSIDSASAQPQAAPLTVTDGFTPPGLEPGTPEHSYALSGFDSISYFSGKMNFRLPLYKVGGRGEAGYSIILPIETHWQLQTAAYFAGVSSGNPNPTGYTFAPVMDEVFPVSRLALYTPGSVVGHVTTFTKASTCQGGPPAPGTFQGIAVLSALTRFTFQEPDGTQHELRDTLTGGQPQNNPNLGSLPYNCGVAQTFFNRGQTFQSYDGSGIKFVTDNPVHDSYPLPDTSPFAISFPTVLFVTGTLYFRDGTQYTIGPQGEVDQIRDRNGNLVTLTYANTNSVGSAATFLWSDAVTQGNWKQSGVFGPVYGVDGYQVIGDQSVNPAYVVPAPAGQTLLTWASSTTDTRALQKASNANDRIAAGWYSNTSFTVDIPMTDQFAHTLTLYFLDWDSQNRTERVDLLDGSGNLLDTRVVAGFNNGVYLLWNVAGHIQVRVTKTGGPNAVLSGIFFDPEIHLFANSHITITDSAGRRIDVAIGGSTPSSPDT